MGESVRFGEYDRIWDALMRRHAAGEPESLHAVCRDIGRRPGTIYFYFRVLTHYGYLEKLPGVNGAYRVVRQVERLPDEVRYTPCNPRSGIYTPQIPRTREQRKQAEREAAARYRERKRAAQPEVPRKQDPNVAAAWRRTLPDGTVVNMHGVPVTRREFKYRVVTCIVCGERTIDHLMHQCVEGWDLTPDRVTCPTCKARMT